MRPAISSIINENHHYQYSPMCTCPVRPRRLPWDEENFVWHSSWRRRYLCQLTMLQRLLFPRQESLVTSARSPDHVYMLPLIPLTPARILIVPFSLYMSLSVRGRFISPAEKRAKNLQTSCQKPFRLFVTLWHSFRSHCSSGFHSGFN